MLAKRRRFILKNGQEVRTPLLLPSFSSKGFDIENVESILSYMEQIIADEILISAYDLWHRKIKKKIVAPSVIFLDSGGYEASEEVELSDVGKRRHTRTNWSLKQHMTVLEKWKFDKPTVVISFDSPTAKASIRKQITRAKRLFSQFPQASSEVLFKTQKRAERVINIEEIKKNVHELSKFDIIGFTEKELGASTLERMKNIADIRNTLTISNLETPIHIFGSLDTVSTPLYFFAGADIFDGLTWLRYAYSRGNTIYKHNYGAIELGISFEDFRVNAKVWNENYYYLTKLKDEMIRFTLEGSFEEFTYNKDVYKKALTQFNAGLQERGIGRDGR